VKQFSFTECVVRHVYLQLVSEDVPVFHPAFSVVRRYRFGVYQ